MTILTEKKKANIVKRLAAIYYTAVHWRNEEWIDFVQHVVENCAEIAFEIGGERTMTIDLPSCVESLENQLRFKPVEPLCTQDEIQHVGYDEAQCGREK